MALAENTHLRDRIQSVKARTANRYTAAAATPPREEGEKRAQLYRMATDEHICPFGLKSRSLLRREGFEVEDHELTTREAQDAFKAEHDVGTTPQTFIGDRRIGGYEDLLEHFGKASKDEDETTYAPVIAIFGMAALMALALVWNLYEGFPILTAIKWFIAFSMSILAIQKLRDIDGFTNGFLGYDLLAQRWVPYAYVYPFAEAWVGIGMIALIGTGSPLVWLVAPVAIFIGAVGSISIVKAAYIEKRDLNCACVGGGSKVPLGAISLTEDLMMVVIGVWMMGTLA